MCARICTNSSSSLCHGKEKLAASLLQCSHDHIHGSDSEPCIHERLHLHSIYFFHVVLEYAPTACFQVRTGGTLAWRHACRWREMK